MYETKSAIKVRITITSLWKCTIPCIIGVAGSWKLVCQGTAASHCATLPEKILKINELIFIY
jgi:hypothetical protein